MKKSIERTPEQLREHLATRTKVTPSGCIEWQKATVYGYGVMNFKLPDGSRQSHKAHRLAWQLAKGPIPQGLCVCHKCDNRRCCNVDHLFLGTSIENNRDRDRKSRHHSKLCVDDVRTIRASPLSIRELAEQYGLTWQSMYQVVSGRRWKNV